MRFFFLPNDVSIKFGSLYKIFTFRKKGFRQCLQYFASLTFVDWVLVTTKEIAARNNKVSILVGEGGGGLRVVSGPWDFQNSQKEVSGNFES